MITLEQMTYLNELSKCTSLTQAANNLFISQPALTNSINKIEHELGFKILDRLPKGVKFTILGLQLLKTSQTILKEYQNIELLKQYNHQIEGNIQIYCVNSFISTILPHVMYQLKKEYPNINISSKEIYVKNILTELAKNSNSFAITIIDKQKQNLVLANFTTKGYTYFPIYTAKLSLLFSKTHPINSTSNYLQELHNYKVGVLRGNSNNTSLLALLKDNLISIDNIVYFESRETLKLAILDSYCIGLLSDIFFLNEISSSPAVISYILPQPYHSTLLYFLLYSNEHLLTTSETIFLNVLKNYTQKNPS